MTAVILKEGREKSLKRGHPWIFSGAIESAPAFSNGDLLSVESSQGEFLAQAFFHTQNSLAGRIFSFDKEPPLHSLRKKLQAAVRLRQTLFDFSLTNGYRLVNAEGDGLSGLIIDIYADVAVLQVSSWGMERWKPQIVELLKELLPLRAIYEKSLSAARLEEGLAPFQGFLWGEPVQDVVIRENGILFHVDILQGQKSGFFLDQREMRAAAGAYCKNRRLLNCFSYSGGFSLAALCAGAAHVTSVDSCPRATALHHRNCTLNNISSERFHIVEQDLFAFLESSSALPYDCIILDPPAFAKKRKDLQNACFGYKKLHRLVFEKAAPGTLLITSSCSAFVNETLFQDLVSQAASEAGREAKILSRHLLAADHPLSLHHPEGAYLKSLILTLS